VDQQGLRSWRTWLFAFETGPQSVRCQLAAHGACLGKSRDRSRCPRSKCGVLAGAQETHGTHND